MSKDAQLLRAMGMGPDERPLLWREGCPRCGGKVDLGWKKRKPKPDTQRICRDGVLKRIFGDADGCWEGVGSETIQCVKFPLGLDLDPSEWTVEHDAAFARVVWPWLRRYVWHSENLADLETSLVELMQIDDCMGTWQKDPFAIWATGSANPGPTMCQAIYNVLCGEDRK